MPRKKRQKTNNKAVGYLLLVVGLLIIASDPRGQAALVVLAIAVLGYFYLTKVHFPQKRKQQLLALGLAQVDDMSGPQFERFVAALLQSQGYKTILTPATNDYGVDIVAERTGVRIAVQCKRHGENLSRDCVSDAVAGKHVYKCGTAMVVTNRRFRSGAMTLAQSTNCILVDRDELILWMEQAQVKNGLIPEPAIVNR
jgi:restriction system protein